MSFSSQGDGGASAEREQNALRPGGGLQAEAERGAGRARGRSAQQQRPGDPGQVERWGVISAQIKSTQPSGAPLARAVWAVLEDGQEGARLSLDCVCVFTWVLAMWACGWTVRTSVQHHAQGVEIVLGQQ